MSPRRAKTIFITGSSSGLGRATAKLFAAKGWGVIATMRNPEKEKELALAVDLWEGGDLPRARTHLERAAELAVPLGFL